MGKKQNFHNICFNMSGQTQGIEENSSWVTSFMLILIVGLLLYWKAKGGRKVKKVPAAVPPIVPQSKIIIALEIDGFLVKYQNRLASACLPLNIQRQESFIAKVFRRVWGLGDYYRPLFSLHKIRDFISGMNSIENAEIFLYSSLPPNVANGILAKLQLDSEFPETHRRFCEVQNHDDMKHAIQIDQDTRRVIIVTPSREDHLQEDEKYFLILRPKTDELNYLRKVFWLLKKFVQEQTDVNTLHDKLGELKADIESDWQDDNL